MGGKAISTCKPVAQADVSTIIENVKHLLPKQLLPNLYENIGSAGYKEYSGDIDLIVEADDVVSLFNSKSLFNSNEVLFAKKALKGYFEAEGIEANVNGRNVSIGVPYSNGYAQVDIMVIKDADLVAPYHQHGPRGMYNDPKFKGNDVFIVMSSIAKYLGMKFDPFGAKLSRRDDNTVVARTRKDVAQILLGQTATEDDLNSVETIVTALKDDCYSQDKLADAQATLGAF